MTANKLPRCWLHIGAPKTGSTALQDFLSSNQIPLLKHGISYPSATLRGYGHHDIAFLSSGAYPEWATPPARSLDELAAELRQEILRSPFPVILSSENFYLLCSPKRTAELLKQLGINISIEEVKVVVYVRRQDEAHASWYNQAVKAQGYCESYEKHAAANWHLWDYAAVLGSWAKIFGTANLIVRPYQAEDLADNDVRKDFLKTLGISENGFEFAPERINTPLNQDILEFQRQLNHLPLPPQEKRRFHKELMALTTLTQGTGLFNDQPPLSYRRRLEILADYERGNHTVAQTYLDREWLFTPPEPASNEQESVGGGLTTEKLTCILGWLLLSQQDSQLPSVEPPTKS